MPSRRETSIYDIEWEALVRSGRLKSVFQENRAVIDRLRADLAASQAECRRLTQQLSSHAAVTGAVTEPRGPLSVVPTRVDLSQIGQFTVPPVVTSQRGTITRVDTRPVIAPTVVEQAAPPEEEPIKNLDDAVQRFKLLELD